MWPPADDNYGSDACSLLCLPVSPPVLVIAHQNGFIHHAILLPRDVDINDRDDERKLSLPEDLHVSYSLIFESFQDDCGFRFCSTCCSPCCLGPA